MSGAEFFGGQYDGRILDHAFRVRHREDGRVDVGFAFHDSFPYDVVIRRREDADEGELDLEDPDSFEGVFEVDTTKRGHTMLIPELRRVILDRVDDTDVTINRNGVIFRDIPTDTRQTLARLVWSVVVPIQRVVLWTEVRHPYRPPTPVDHTDELEEILAAARTPPPRREPPPGAAGPETSADADDQPPAEDGPLAFLPSPDPSVELDTEAVETDHERIWHLRVWGDTLALTAADGEIEREIDLTAPFTATLTYSRRADDTCPLLHLAVRQTIEKGEDIDLDDEDDEATHPGDVDPEADTVGGTTVRIGLTSRTEGFTAPVDRLAEVGARHPMIVESAMRELLARLRAAMRMHGEGVESWQ